MPFHGRGVEVMALFHDEPYGILLESRMRDPFRGRYSFIGFDPFAVYRFPEDGESSLEFEARMSQDPFGNLRRLFDPFRQTASSFPPLRSGVMGFLSYDLGLYLEGLGSVPHEGRRAPFLSARQNEMPLGVLGFYDRVIAIDHFGQTLTVFSSGLPERRGYLRQKRARVRLRETVERLEALEGIRTGRVNFPVEALFDRNDGMVLLEGMGKPEYVRMVNAALKLIRQGDIYQVNLARRFSLDALVTEESINPFRLYRLLTDESPAHFCGYMNGGGWQIISSSPERFLCKRDRQVQSRPMKGTRPRGGDLRSDREYQRDLLASEKDQAELLMITDLMRNDLGRVCEYGSVRVRDLRTLEAYRTVYQTTSTIEGRLHRDRDEFDLLRACFPGGSITGCPKIRAMEVIRQLEPVRRGAYTGSLGYLSFDGTMDWNILIRSFVWDSQGVSFHAGGGIVADSDPQTEYDETMVKAYAMKQCLRRAVQLQGVRA
jgi:para-aminobenzoate synthetase component 1